MSHIVIAFKLRGGHRHFINWFIRSLWFFNLKLFINYCLICCSWSWLTHFHRRCWTWLLLRLMHVIRIVSSLVFRMLVLLFLYLRKLSFFTMLLLLLVLSCVILFFILTFSFCFNNLISHILRLYYQIILASNFLLLRI